MKRDEIWLFCVLLGLLCASCGGGTAPGKVQNANGRLPEFPKIDVSDPARFLNDLMLSPLWKVEKERDGSFIASARSIMPDDTFDETGRQFLFELLATADKTPPQGLPHLRNAPRWAEDLLVFLDLRGISEAGPDAHDSCPIRTKCDARRVWA